MELRQAKGQGVAKMIQRDGVITGYAAGIGILCYAVARSNEDLKTLVANASAIIIFSICSDGTKIRIAFLAIRRS
jgi:hypothetical protein